MSDVSELLLKVKGVEKAKHDLNQVQSSMKQTGEAAKNMFTAMASGWGFKQLLEFGNKFSNFWEKNTLAISNFKSIFGSFNKEAQKGVDLLKGSFDETDRTAKIISNTIGNMLSDLNLTRGELGQVVTDLAGSVANIASQHGLDIQQVARKIGSALRGEVDGLKELGIVIKKDSLAIQDGIKQFRSVGFGQREAEMMAIAKALIQNSLKFENSFTDIQMSFAHQIGNLKNTLESGIFVGIGKILNLLSPLLILLNKLLENKWVIAIASVTSSIVLLTSSMKLLMFTSKQLIGVMKLLGVTGMFGKKSNFSYVPLLLKRTFVEIAAVFEGGFVLIKGLLKGATIGLPTILNSMLKDLAFKMRMAFIRNSGGVVNGNDILNIARQHFSIKFAKGFSKIGVVIADGLYKLLGKVFKPGSFASVLLRGSIVGGVTLSVTALLGAILIKGIISAVDALKNSPAVKSTVEKVKVGVLNVLYKLSLIGTDILSSIRNFAKGEGFESDATKAKQMIQELNSSLPGLTDAFSTFTSDVKAFLTEWNGLVKNTSYSISDYEQIKSQVEQRLKNAKKDFETAEFTWNLYLEQAKFASEKAKEFAEINKTEEAKVWGEEALLFKNAAEEERGKADKLLNIYNDLLSKYKEASSEIDTLTRKIHANKFETKTTFSDFSKDIEAAFKDLKLEDSVKYVNEKIKALNEKYFDNGKFRSYFNIEDQRQYYIELANLEKSKFDIQVENLKAEEELIKSNRELINETLEKMLEFKAQGVSGINANSAEGYKFMTSSIGDITAVKGAWNNQANQEAMFREKTISIQSKTKDILSKIKEKIDVLDNSERSSKLIIVN